MQPPGLLISKLVRHSTKAVDYTTAEHQEHDERYQRANEAVADDLMGDEPPSPLHRHRVSLRSH